MFSMNDLQSKLLTLRNELREAGRGISNEILTAQDETDRAGALLAERMIQAQRDEVEEFARHNDAMNAIRSRRETALNDYGMQLKAVDDRVRLLGNNLIETPHAPNVKAVR